MSTRTATTKTRTTALVVPRKTAAATASGDIRAVAIASIETVADISRTIIVKDKSAAPFCRSLRAVLWTIKAHLEKQRDSLCEVADAKKKLEGFLNNLERLCAWPLSVKGGPANPWPTLKAAKFATGKANAVECLRKFATDTTLYERRADIIVRFGKFASKSLSKETAEVTQNVEAPASQGPFNASHELDDDIEHLLKILRQYGSCHADGNCCEISTNIRLNGYRALGTGRQGKKSSALTDFIADNASAEFGVLFLDHPHATEGCWQEASIQICQSIVSKAPLIRFADDEVQFSALEATASVQQTLLSCETFCQQISSRGQDLLRLSARDDEFLYHKRADATRDWLAQHDAVPLSQILTRPGMNLYDKSKAILEFLVARATWQFYTSEAIGQGLTSDSVYFVHEQRFNRNGVFVNEPMLLMQLQYADGATRDPSPFDMIHDMPKILSLGIVLLELETRKSMHKHRENSKLCPPGRFNANTDYRIASNLVDDGPDAHPESILSDIDPRSPLRRILPLCIRAGHLRSKVQQNLSARKKGNKSKVDINESNALRATIYSEIVQPLEQWANQYDDLERVKPLYELADAPVSRMSAPQQPTETAVPRPNAANMPSDQQLRKLSRQWFERYEKLSGALQPIGTEAAGQAYRATRIAVLDTGLHRKDYEYFKEASAGIYYADFVESAPTPCDNTGHGSTAVSLLIKTCPNASLHIARVLKSNLATMRDVSTIIQGIDWAISQEVDIISMAIGFENEHHSLVEAIGRAHARGILIFSAASNGRNIDPVYCPAIITDQVFGMFSTNAGVRESTSINPSPLDASVSFAIFGEDVEIHEDRPLLKGTSYSTSIGAGVAAALLDFSRQGHDGNIGRLCGFRGRQQMKRVLLEMSTPDGNYKCIRPWSLLKTDVRQAEDRSVQREWIRGTIERLLQPENLYGGQRR